MAIDRDQAEQLQRLDARLEEASRSSRLSSWGLAFGLLMTVIAAGLAVYNTVLLQAELERVKAELSQCKSKSNICSTEPVIDEAKPPAEQDDVQQHADSPSEQVQTALTSEQAAAVAVTEGVSEETTFRRDVEPIQYAICSDPRMKQLSQGFWREWNKVKPQIDAQQARRLDAQLDEKLAALIDRCGISRTPPVDTAAVERALPCLRKGYQERSKWLERTVDG